MNGKQLALILALIGAATLLIGQQHAPKTPEFESWKAKHSITFSSEMENAYRERIFLENLGKIETHNSNAYRTYDMGLNQFSAMTQEEFAETYLTLKVPQTNEEVVDSNDVYLGDVDWTTKGAVTGVKNQGSCGSCWAFSATGGLEGLSFLKGKLESFSEQQLVDCSGSYGNQACNGGLMDNAFKYVKANGILHESEYPYKAVKQTCQKNAGPFKISGYTDIKDCTKLANDLAGRPISVAVDASNWSSYRSGVFNNCKTSLNHGVLLVGATAQDWKVKNSWGTSWGEKGFIRLARGDTCGICRQASYPTK
jgi:C1A family cysteine protease